LQRCDRVQIVNVGSLPGRLGNLPLKVTVFGSKAWHCERRFFNA
jgi:hypothetical protein